MVFPTHSIMGRRHVAAFKGMGQYDLNRKLMPLDEIAQHAYGATFKANYIGLKLQATVTPIHVPQGYSLLLPQYCLRYNSDDRATSPTSCKEFQGQKIGKIP